MTFIYPFLTQFDIFLESSKIALPDIWEVILNLFIHFWKIIKATFEDLVVYDSLPPCNTVTKTIKYYSTDGVMFLIQLK